LKICETLLDLVIKRNGKRRRNKNVFKNSSKRIKYLRTRKENNKWYNPSLFII